MSAAGDGLARRDVVRERAPHMIEDEETGGAVRMGEKGCQMEREGAACEDGVSGVRSSGHRPASGAKEITLAEAGTRLFVLCVSRLILPACSQRK